MLNTVKNAMHTIGDSTGDLARRIGGDAADLAKKVSGEATGLARSVGCGTASLARRIGPKRALLGVAILGAVVGGSLWLARYLRMRKEELTVGADLGADEDQRPGRGQKRQGKHGAEQYSH